MTFTNEYSILGHEYRVHQDEEGKYHIDMDERTDIHGPMNAEAFINWLSHTINALSYKIEKLEKQASESAENEVSSSGNTDPHRIVAQGGFNTGRLYSIKGQRIYWAQRADGWLGFVDHDRMINGWIKRSDPVSILESDILPEWLMRNYDHHLYTISAPEGWNVKIPKDFEYKTLRL